MSPIKKSDVKNHLSAHNRAGKHLFHPISQPDAIGFQKEESGRKDPKPNRTVEESVNQPSSNGLETPPNVIASGSGGATSTGLQKSAKA